MSALDDRPWVYVAGPYSRPDPVENTRRAVFMADRLWVDGFCPVVPHLAHLWHLVSPKPYGEWLDVSRQWLLRCDALFRLAGVSVGADSEIVVARAREIPVYDEREYERLVDDRETLARKEIKT